MSHNAGPAGDGDVSPRRSNSPLGPQITPIYVTDERGDRGKRNPGLAAAVKLPASSAVVRAAWHEESSPVDTVGYRAPDWGAIRRPTPRCRGGGRSF